MKRIILIMASFLCCWVSLMAQETKIFARTLYNKEYDIYVIMNLYDKNVTIGGQEFMGQMDGFIGDKQDFRKWFILDSKIKKTSATLSISNDEGSEDLTATLTYDKKSGTYTLTQKEGSTLKIARSRKWVKLPKVLTFVVQ